MPLVTRRTALATLAGGLAAAALPAGARAAPADLVTRPIPSTGERIPVVGMGTWQTFNVGGDPVLREQRADIVRVLFDGGGRVIDSSPMYGSSQHVVGWCLDHVSPPKDAFAADKIWTRDGDETREQYEETRAAWSIPRMDLMQVHNLVAWKAHLATLQKMKADGTIRFVGITTSHGRRHRELAEVMRSEPIDFVQLTYNMTHREVEKTLLPLARERGIAVIANRPFDGGGLVKGLQRAGHPLPPWAGEIGAANWPQFLLKWIVSHPALTVAIPATTQVEHMRENIGAAHGAMPDTKTRERMSAYLKSL